MKIIETWKAITSLVPKKTKPSVPEAKVASHFAISFLDIKDSIKYFDGISSDLVQKWIADIRWSSLHLFTFAKGSLTGFRPVPEKKKALSLKHRRRLLFKEYVLSNRKMSNFLRSINLLIKFNDLLIQYNAGSCL